MNIREISADEANLLQKAWSFDRKSTEKGLFWYRGSSVFVGIDNRTGDFWVEEFDTLEDCLTWLNGKEKDEY